MLTLGRRGVWAVFFGIIVLGVFLRLYMLGHFNLWSDEALSVDHAQRIGWHLSIFSKYDFSPPLYHLILHAWMKIFGTSEFSVRLLSSLASVLVLFLIFFIGKYFYGVRVGLLSCLFLAVSPFQIWYAQEARAYSLAAFFFLALFYVFMRQGTYKNQSIFVIFFCTLAAINIYMSHVSHMLVWLLVFYGIVAYSKKIFILAGICIASVSLPLYPSILLQVGNVQAGLLGWIKEPHVGNFVNTLGIFFLGYSATKEMYIVVIWILFCLFGAWVAFAPKNKNFFLLVMGSFVPVASIYFFSVVSASIFLPRYFIACAPLFFIIVAQPLGAIRSGLIKSSLIVFFLVLMFLSLMNYYSGIMLAPLEFHPGVPLKKDFQYLVRIVQKDRQEGDVIVHSNEHSFSSFRYYFLNKPIRQVALFIPEKVEPSLRFFREGYSESFQSRMYIEFRDVAFFRGVPRIWLVSMNWLRDGNFSENSSAVLTKAERCFKKVREYHHEGITMTLFDTRDFSDACMTQT